MYNLSAFSAMLQLSKYACILISKPYFVRQESKHYLLVDV